ncbi:MAG: hypothetical protein IJV76_10915, partial [Clostridia bacterium]|nr:hypothetical protein [Clostridia bacterium]
MTSKMHFTSRTGAALLLLAVLLTMCFPLTLFAEEAAETPAFYAEPVLMRADDYTEALTGFRLVADNPDNLALTLTYSVYAAGDMTGAITQDSPWITVTAMETPAGQEDAAVLGAPAFTVDFHKPADITVEDPDYIDMPVFLRPVSVSGTTIYTLAPGYLIEF